MPILDKNALVTAIVPPLNNTLVKQLLNEFISIERRFVLRDWEPATLDGGQFAEAAARITYNCDSGNLNLTRSVDDCLSFVEDFKQQNKHSFPDRKASLHICKVIRTIYKFRSDRGAVHISPTYNANHVDSKLVLECVRWLLSEFLRIFWTNDREIVAKAIREIVQFDIPAIGTYDGRKFVLRTDCSVEEEILLLLHSEGENGLSRKDLGKLIPKSAPSISNSLKVLLSNKKREAILLDNGNIRLTDNGIKRVLYDLSDKLSI